MPLILRKVGRYEILREIGRGGMGLVYLARQTDLDRSVALKELGASFASDPAFADRFVRESRLAGGLNHPNIVTVYDFFEHNGLPYISMEYLERGSLRPWVDKLTLAQIAGVLEGLLAGLAHAGSRGIVHRDLKPENVLVTLEGGVKIADFGIAKAYNTVLASGQFQTDTRTAVGTPTYMAPEQALGKELGPWTDLYSVGVMAYEMIVGRVPFYEVETPLAILLHHVNEPPPSPQSVEPGLDPELASWIERLLEKDPPARPAEAQTAWDQFEEIVIRLLGSAWRREARLLDRPADAESAVPLTPAVFTPAEPPSTARGEVTSPSDDAEPHPGSPPTVPADRAPPRPADDTAGAARTATAPAGGQPAASAGLEADDAEPQAADEPTDVRATRPGPQPSIAVTPPPAERVPPPQVDEAPDQDVARVETTVPVPADRVAGDERAAGRARPRRFGRARLIWVAVALGALAAGGVAIALVRGGSKATSTTAATGARVVPPEPRPTAREHADLAVTSSSVYVATAGGHVLRLAGTTLRPEAATADAAGPQGIAVSGDDLVVGDRDTLTTLAGDDLAPVSSRAFPQAADVASTGRMLLAVRSAGPSSSRVCTVNGRRCTALPFVPSGFGAAPGKVFVADGKAGTVEILPAATLGRTRPIRVGSYPHGRLIAFLQRLYVPIERGVAVVDLTTRRLLRTIPLVATPSDVWIVPTNGFLVATLYADNRVAILDTASSTGKPRLVDVPSRPVAVAGPPASAGPRNDVYVLGAGNWTVSRLSSRTGKVLRSERLPGLTTPTRPPTALAPTFRADDRHIVATLRVAGGTLGRTSIVVTDKAIGDGRAAVRVWQGGARSHAGGPTKFQGLTLAVVPEPGRLTVTLESKPRSFTSLAVARIDGGRAIRLTVGKPHPATVPTPVTTPPTRTSPQPQQHRSRSRSRSSRPARRRSRSAERPTQGDGNGHPTGLACDQPVGTSVRRRALVTTRPSTFTSPVSSASSSEQAFSVTVSSSWSPGWTKWRKPTCPAPASRHERFVSSSSSRAARAPRLPRMRTPGRTWKRGKWLSKIASVFGTFRIALADSPGSTLTIRSSVVQRLIYAPSARLPFRTTSDAFVPPNANAFNIAARTSRSRAVFGM